MATSQPEMLRAEVTKSFARLPREAQAWIAIESQRAIDAKAAPRAVWHNMFAFLSECVEDMGKITIPVMHPFRANLSNEHASFLSCNNKATWPPLVFPVEDWMAEYAREWTGRRIYVVSKRKPSGPARIIEFPRQEPV